MSDEEIVGRVRAGEVDLFEILMRRYDQRVYRMARAVLANDAEAEDVTQEAWVRAFAHLDQFGGRARFSTWLIRITLHEAWARARRSGRFEPIGPNPNGEDEGMRDTSSEGDPEKEALGGELRSVLEAAIEALPKGYREVFVMREIEELSTTETAETLELTEEAVKTRLHRARAFLRQDLLTRAGAGIRQTFPFLGDRCDRTVQAVFARIERELTSRARTSASPAARIH